MMETKNKRIYSADLLDNLHNQFRSELNMDLELDDRIRKELDTIKTSCSKLRSIVTFERRNTSLKFNESTNIAKEQLLMRVENTCNDIDRAMDNMHKESWRLR